MLATLRLVGRVRVFPHATYSGDRLVKLGLARWGDPARTLRGGTYGRWLVSTEPGPWRRDVCKCCGGAVLVHPDGEIMMPILPVDDGRAA